MKQFITSIFTEAMPRTGVGGVVTASDLLSAATERLDRELSHDPTVAAELGFIIAEGFSNLGEPAKGEALLRSAAPQIEKAFGPAHPLTIRTKTLLASVIVLHDVEGALAVVTEVTPAAVKGLPATATLAVDALEQQSFMLAKLNQSEASYAALRQAIAIGEQYLGPNHEETVWALGLLSNTYARFGNRRLQLDLATRAVDRARRVLGPRRPQLTLTAVERWYADALRANGRPGEAVPILWQVLKDQQQLDPTPTVRVPAPGAALPGADRHRAHRGLPAARGHRPEPAAEPAESDDRRLHRPARRRARLGATDRGSAHRGRRLKAMVERLGVEPPPAMLQRRIRRATTSWRCGDFLRGGAARAGERRR